MPHCAIYPSLISAHLVNLEQVISELNPHVAGYHLDIMDNHFVPNLTMGHLFVNQIAKITNRQLWIHLMIDNPEPFLSRLEIPAQSIVGFHIETKCDHNQVINKITENNWLPCLAISPKTPIEKIFPFMNHIHQVNLMSVEPGFSGQRFLNGSLDRLLELVHYRKKHKLNCVIGIDGGINQENISDVCTAGAQHIAIASALFNYDNPVARLQLLQKIIS